MGGTVFALEEKRVEWMRWWLMSYLSEGSHLSEFLSVVRSERAIEGCAG